MKVFVFSHTHWDREWFLTSEYTSEFLEEFFKNLLDLMERKEDLYFILDGQTLILEDLFEKREDFEDKVKKLVSEGRLIIGPVYAQIDWRISPDFAIWKNFSIGKKDMERFKARKFCGWFMDNFGQFAQLPQILKTFGIDCVFLWRGVRFPDDKERVVFRWKAPDGSSILAYFLLWGYRNLYNLAGTESMAKDRFEGELEKERVFTGHPLLLDGYDLDTHPEDPRDFVEVAVNPFEFVESLKGEDLEEIEGEMISGRYASVFPGTLSTRSYLKVGMEIVGGLLRAASILGVDDEKSWREYIKTLVHDNICGVGVDQIHEKMERVYRDLYEKLKERIKKAVGRFGAGDLYVLNLSNLKRRFWFAQDVGEYLLDLKGAGIWKVEGFGKWREGKSLRFKNDFYSFEAEDGRFFMDGVEIGKMVLERDKGDAYSSWPEKVSFKESVEVEGIMDSDNSKVIELKRKLSFEGVEVLTEERVFLDESPLVRWRVKIFPKGVDYRLLFGIEEVDGDVLAGMPFYDAERRASVNDNLPLELDGRLREVLLAAREVGGVEEFPYQGYVFRAGVGLLSRGLRGYVTNGGLYTVLMRSVEWIAREVEGRTGDAGPEMYVPGARSERFLALDLAFMKMVEGWKEWAELFLNFPILFRSKGEREVEVSFYEGEGRLVVVDGKGIFLFGDKIVTKDLDLLKGDEGAEVELVDFPDFPFGEDLSLPDERVLEDMEKDVERMGREMEGLKDMVKDLEGVERVKVEHRIYTLERKILEKRLSILLNEERLGKDRSEEIMRVGRLLNEARQKKRTYDYVLEMFLSKEGGN